jgi:hypothetical protein
MACTGEWRTWIVNAHFLPTVSDLDQVGDIQISERWLLNMWKNLVKNVADFAAEAAKELREEAIREAGEVRGRCSSRSISLAGRQRPARAAATHTGAGSPT